MKPTGYLRGHFLWVSERFVHLKKVLSPGMLYFFCNGSQIGSLEFFCKNDGIEFLSVLKFAEDILPNRLCSNFSGNGMYGTRTIKHSKGGSFILYGRSTAELEGLED